MAEPTTLTDQTRFDTNEWPYSIKFQDFATFLGLPANKDSKGIYWRGDYKTAKKIEEIYSWGKSATNSDDHIRVKTAIKTLQRKLGTNMQGKSLVDVLWQYTQMATEQAFLDEQLGQLRKEKIQEKAKPKVAKKTTAPAIKSSDVQKQVAKAAEQVKVQVQQQTRQAVQKAIEEGIKSAFK